MKEELWGKEPAEHLARLEELLDLELSWCGRLRQLSVCQLQMCASGRSSQLPGVLQERMKCLERLSELETTLTCVATGVGDLGSSRPSQTIDRVKSKVIQIESVAKEVAALDAQCGATLRAELERTEEGLRGLNRQLQVAESYAGPGWSNGHVVVVRG